MRDPVHVDAVHPLKVRGLGLPQVQVGSGNAGVIAQDMAGTVDREHLIGQRFHRLRAGNIGDHAAHGATEFPRRGLERARLDIGDHHFHARAEEGPGQRLADSARAARNHRHPVLEFFHCIRPALLFDSWLTVSGSGARGNQEFDHNSDDAAPRMAASARFALISR